MQQRSKIDIIPSSNHPPPTTTDANPIITVTPHDQPFSLKQTFHLASNSLHLLNRLLTLHFHRPTQYLIGT
ncbi:hypothetical protein ACHAXM_009020 [Skeletonema potamos]